MLLGLVGLVTGEDSFVELCDDSLGPASKLSGFDFVKLLTTAEIFVEGLEHHLIDASFELQEIPELVGVEGRCFQLISYDFFKMKNEADGC